MSSLFGHTYGGQAQGNTSSALLEKALKTFGEEKQKALLEKNYQGYVDAYAKLLDSAISGYQTLKQTYNNPSIQKSLNNVVQTLIQEQTTMGSASSYRGPYKNSNLAYPPQRGPTFGSPCENADTAEDLYRQMSRFSRSFYRPSPRLQPLASNFRFLPFSPATRTWSAGRRAKIPLSTTPAMLLSCSSSLGDLIFLY